MTAGDIYVVFRWCLRANLALEIFSILRLIAILLYRIQVIPFFELGIL